MICVCVPVPQDIQLVYRMYDMLINTNCYSSRTQQTNILDHSVLTRIDTMLAVHIASVFVICFLSFHIICHS